ncbi:MAG: ribonuclease III [Planctomycetes bacterium]|nr:ribonuclease III [Planctomycetota bacterium]
MSEHVLRKDIIADVLGHQFSQLDLLDQACTHASYGDSNSSATERSQSNNERMEYLGDAFLGAAISEILYQRYPNANEGDLSRHRSQLVSRFMLARAIESIGILEHCLFGHNVEDILPDSIKANIAEGILGAIYLDAGWSALREAVDRLLSPLYDEANGMNQLTEAKNELQTWALKYHKSLPKYSSKRQGGSDHQPQFSCTVQVAHLSADATGGSKRKSESLAAQNLLKQITDNTE